MQPKKRRLTSVIWKVAASAGKLLLAVVFNVVVQLLVVLIYMSIITRH